MTTLVKHLSTVSFFLFFMASSLLAQTPTGIDPGYNDEEVFIWDDPLYIMIGVILLLLVIFILLRRSRVKRPTKKD